MKGATLWIIGFFAFLAGLNSVNATVLWAQLGPEAMIQPYLIGSLTGELSVATYLWISILATFVFLSMTFSSIISKLPDPIVLHDIMDKVDDLEKDQKVLQKIKTGLILIEASLNDFRTGFLEGFREQEEQIKGIRGELGKKFDKKLADLKQETTKQLGKMEKAVQRVGQTNKKNVTTVKKQIKEISSMKSKLERLEMELTQPKPQLTSQSELKRVKGIGRYLANELRGIGITSVGELILTDPLTIAAKTGTSQRTVEKLQGRAQLLMVPGIKEKDLTLLEELGITTRRKLGYQDPIELGKKMNGIHMDYVEKGKISKAEKPTIEEIDSWIKFAKS